MSDLIVPNKIVIAFFSAAVVAQSAAIVTLWMRVLSFEQQILDYCKLVSLLSR